MKESSPEPEMPDEDHDERQDDHTYEHFMQALFLPKLLDRSRYDSWRGDGALDLYKRCNVEAKRILEEHEVIPKPDDILKEIDGILQRR